MGNFFRSKLMGVNFVCIALLVAILILLFYPGNSQVKFDAAAFSTVLAGKLHLKMGLIFKLFVKKRWFFKVIQ